MSDGHDHAAGKSEKALWIALGLTSTILIAETVGGIVTGSLALISDAAHMLTDAAALAIAGGDSHRQACGRPQAQLRLLPFRDPGGGV